MSALCLLFDAENNPLTSSQDCRNQVFREVRVSTAPYTLSQWVWRFCVPCPVLPVILALHHAYKWLFRLDPAPDARPHTNSSPDAHLFIRQGILVPNFEKIPPVQLHFQSRLRRSTIHQETCQTVRQCSCSAPASFRLWAEHGNCH